MKTIHKFPVPMGKFSLAIPRFSDVLKIDTQHNQPFMWVLLDDAAPKQRWSFQTTVTGGNAEHCFKAHLPGVILGG